MNSIQALLRISHTLAFESSSGNVSISPLDSHELNALNQLITNLYRHYQTHSQSMSVAEISFIYCGCWPLISLHFFDRSGVVLMTQYSNAMQNSNNQVPMSKEFTALLMTQFCPHSARMTEDSLWTKCEVLQIDRQRVIQLMQNSSQNYGVKVEHLDKTEPNQIPEGLLPFFGDRILQKLEYMSTPDTWCADILKAFTLDEYLAVDNYLSEKEQDQEGQFCGKSTTTRTKIKFGQESFSVQEVKKKARKRKLKPRRQWDEDMTMSIYEPTSMPETRPQPNKKARRPRNNRNFVMRLLQFEHVKQEQEVEVRKKISKARKKNRSRNQSRRGEVNSEAFEDETVSIPVRQKRPNKGKSVSREIVSMQGESQSEQFRPIRRRCAKKAIDICSEGLSGFQEQLSDNFIVDDFEIQFTKKRKPLHEQAEEAERQMPQKLDNRFYQVRLISCGIEQATGFSKYASDLLKKVQREASYLTDPEKVAHIFYKVVGQISEVNQVRPDQLIFLKTLCLVKLIVAKAQASTSKKSQSLRLLQQLESVKKIEQAISWLLLTLFCRYVSTVSNYFASNATAPSREFQLLTSIFAGLREISLDINSTIEECIVIFIGVLSGTKPSPPSTYFEKKDLKQQYYRLCGKSLLHLNAVNSIVSCRVAQKLLASLKLVKESKLSQHYKNYLLSLEDSNSDIFIRHMANAEALYRVVGEDQGNNNKAFEQFKDSMSLVEARLQKSLTSTVRTFCLQCIKTYLQHQILTGHKKFKQLLNQIFKQTFLSAVKAKEDKNLSLLFLDCSLQMLEYQCFRDDFVLKEIVGGMETMKAVPYDEQIFVKLAFRVLDVYTGANTNRFLDLVGKYSSVDQLLNPLGMRVIRRVKLWIESACSGMKELGVFMGLSKDQKNRNDACHKLNLRLKVVEQQLIEKLINQPSPNPQHQLLKHILIFQEKGLGTLLSMPYVSISLKRKILNIVPLFASCRWELNNSEIHQEMGSDSDDSTVLGLRLMEMTRENNLKKAVHQIIEKLLKQQNSASLFWLEPPLLKQEQAQLLSLKWQSVGAAYGVRVVFCQTTLQAVQAFVIKNILSKDYAHLNPHRLNKMTSHQLAAYLYQQILGTFRAQGGFLALKQHKQNSPSEDFHRHLHHICLTACLSSPQASAVCKDLFRSCHMLAASDKPVSFWRQLTRRLADQSHSTTIPLFFQQYASMLAYMQQPEILLTEVEDYLLRHKDLISQVKQHSLRNPSQLTNLSNMYQDLLLLTSALLQSQKPANKAISLLNSWFNPESQPAHIYSYASFIMLDDDDSPIFRQLVGLLYWVQVYPNNIFKIKRLIQVMSDVLVTACFKSYRNRQNDFGLLDLEGTEPSVIARLFGAVLSFRVDQNGFETQSCQHFKKGMVHTLIRSLLSKSISFFEQDYAIDVAYRLKSLNLIKQTYPELSAAVQNQLSEHLLALKTGLLRLLGVGSNSREQWLAWLCDSQLLRNTASSNPGCILTLIQKLEGLQILDPATYIRYKQILQIAQLPLR